MKRSSCSHLWRLWVLLAGLAASSTTWADALSAVEVLREGGCGGTMPAAPPLRHNPMLDRAAAAWAMGQPLPVASERNGYRGDFTAGMHISGADSATLELLRRSGCRIVAGRGMRDIGEYRRGFDTWLVVGAFYRLPPGLQASTGTWMPAPASGWRVPPTSPPVGAGSAVASTADSTNASNNCRTAVNTGTLTRAGDACTATRQRRAGSWRSLWRRVVRAGAAGDVVGHARGRRAGSCQRYGRKELLRACRSGRPLAGGSGSRCGLLRKAGRRKYRLRPQVGRRSGAGLARQSWPLREHHGPALRRNGAWGWLRDMPSVGCIGYRCWPSREPRFASGQLPRPLGARVGAGGVSSAQGEPAGLIARCTRAFRSRRGRCVPSAGGL